MEQGQVAPATVGGVASAEDKRFAAEAVQGGTAEIQEATLALQKSTSPAVRAFAQQMIADHKAANAKLNGLLRRKSISAPLDAGPAHQADLAKLNSLNGAAFNSAYLKGQQKDHQAMIALMQAEMKNGKDSDFAIYAKETLPVIQRHLAMATSALSEKSTPM
jgi:putative membrane protein